MKTILVLVVMGLAACGGGEPCTTNAGPATCWPSSGPEWWCKLDSGEGAVFECKRRPTIFQCQTGPYASCVP